MLISTIFCRSTESSLLPSFPLSFTFFPLSFNFLLTFPASSDAAAVRSVSEQVQSADNSQALAARAGDEPPVSVAPSDSG